jgi:hypothetical protein
MVSYAYISALGRLIVSGNAKGPLFKLPLSEKYDIFTTNLTGLFSRSLQPEDDFRNSQDGAMFATDNEFLLYGYVDLYPISVAPIYFANEILITLQGNKIED